MLAEDVGGAVELSGAVECSHQKPPPRASRLTPHASPRLNVTPAHCNPRADNACGKSTRALPWFALRVDTRQSGAAVWLQPPVPHDDARGRSKKLNTKLRAPRHPRLRTSKTAMSGAATPYAPASARASVAPTPAQPPPPPVSALPPPSTFDILPDLHRVLSRLISTSVQPPGAAPTPGPPSADGPLDIQQVSTAATEVKLKLQKARKAVMALPDIDRSIEDQQDEIDFLEARIAKLKAALQALGKPPQESEHVDQSMTG